MGYTLESVNDCTKKLVFNFEDVDLTTQIESALKEKQKTANIKGFRKGKAPLAMIQKVYGPQVENDALSRFVSQEFYKAIQEEKLKAVGYPQFQNTNFDGKKVSFEATVEIFPEFELGDFSKFEFTKDDETVSEDDLKGMVDQYLGPKSEMVEVKDDSVALAKGQFAVFNFEGEKPDGSRPDNMKAEEFLLEIGSGQFIPGFEEGMIGMKKGEKKTLELTFPADYHEEDLRDALVKFDVELLEIKEKQTPELTDELVKEFGFESVDDFNTKNKKRLEDQKKRQVQAKLQEEILNKLIAENNYCPFVKILAICYTLQLTDVLSQASYKIHITHDREKSTTYFLLLVDNHVIGFKGDVHVHSSELPSTLNSQFEYDMPPIQ